MEKHVFCPKNSDWLSMGLPSEAELKRPSMEWKHTDSLLKKNFQIQ